MAKIVPYPLPEGTDRSEIDVAVALSKLSSGWLAFHSVYFTYRHGQRLIDGEADFVVIHRNFGIFILEVKGGQISLKDGRWYSTPRGSSNPREIKDPLAQARKNKYAIQTQLQDAMSEPSLRLGHLVAFPASNFVTEGGVSVDLNFILNKRNIETSETFEQSIIGALKHQNVLRPIDEVRWNFIERLLSPTIHAPSTLESLVDEIELHAGRMTKLTSEQIAVLAQLNSRNRVAVIGSAGTGKTLLAIHQAKKFLADGERVLFVSGTQGLREVLPRLLTSSQEQEIEYEAFGPGLAFRTRGMLVSPQIPPSAKLGSSGWAAEIEETAKGAVKFDALVIDEAQELNAVEIRAMTRFLIDPESSPVFLFLDPKQRTGQGEWKLPFEMQTQTLTVNCRNTREIHDSFSRVINPQSVASGVSGPLPAFIAASTVEDVAAEIESIYVDFRKRHEQATRRPTFAVVRSDLAHPSLKAIIPNAEIQRSVKTLSRFSGREADAVVFVVDGNLQDLDVWHRDFYRGASRAKAELYVIGNAAVLAYLESLQTSNSPEDFSDGP